MTGAAGGPDDGARASVDPSVVTADRRLGPYTLLASVGTVLALITGSPAFVALAAPAVVLLAWSTAAGRPPGVRATVVDPPVRLPEDDAWELVVDLAWSGAAEVDVIHSGLRGHRPAGPTGVTVTAVGGHRLGIPVVAEQWGRHDLGRLAIRARRPGGLVVHDLVVDLPGSVRVLPGSSRLDALVHPARPRAAAGAHRAPTRGPGTDFADLRPYAPGDRLRDLSWAASARSEEPWIVVHHPERSGTVVLLLDGFLDAGSPPGALDRAARVVWSVARHHLASGDRVGLLTAGPTPDWLPPVAGRRSRWQVLDALLRAGAPPSRPSGHRPIHPVPADAFVVGVSPLQSDAFVAAVAHHRRIGRPTAVVGVETADLLPATTDEVERAARRLWRLDADVRRAELSRTGVRTVVVGDDVTPAIRALSSLRHRALGVRA